MRLQCTVCEWMKRCLCVCASARVWESPQFWEPTNLVNKELSRGPKWKYLKLDDKLKSSIFTTLPLRCDFLHPISWRDLLLSADIFNFESFGTFFWTLSRQDRLIETKCIKNTLTFSISHIFLSNLSVFIIVFTPIFCKLFFSFPK